MADTQVFNAKRLFPLIESLKMRYPELVLMIRIFPRL